MSCEYNHETCIGPICTLSSGPKRPLSTAGKLKADIMAGWEALHPSIVKKTANSLLVHFYRTDGALAFISKAIDIRYKQDYWAMRVDLKSTESEVIVRLTLSKKAV